MGDAGRRFALRVLSGNLVCLTVAFSQRSLTSFGPCIEHRLEFAPAGLAISAVSPSAVHFAVSSADHPSLQFYTLTREGEVVLSGSVPTRTVLRDFSAVDIDKDGQREYVGLAAAGNSIAVVKTAGGSATEKDIPLDAQAQRYVIADIDMDGRSDLLLYGKSMSGVATLLGASGGTFNHGPLLFPEFSASDVSVTDLNGDGIPDVFLVNWLSNQVVLYFGITKKVFSEQVTLNLPGEPGGLALTQGRRGRWFRVAVPLPTQSEVLVYSANATGEFRLDQTIALPGRPGRIRFADLNNDRVEDLVTLTSAGLVVCLAHASGSFGKPTVFGLASDDAVWEITDLDGDRRNDLVLLDRTSRRLFLTGNADHTGNVAWPASYLVGRSPAGVVLVDANHDGATDIAVANTSSSTLSLLLNAGKGNMRGQTSINVPARPVYVMTPSADDTGFVSLLTSHPTTERIAAVQIGQPVTQSVVLEVATASQPFILDAMAVPGSRHLRMLVRTISERLGSAALSLFEQINENQFIEKRFRVSLPKRIAAMTVGDFAGHGNHDLIFVTDEGFDKPATVHIAAGTSDYDFRTVRPVFTMADSVHGVSDIYRGDLDNDGILDLVIAVNLPRPALGVILGQGQGEFRGPVKWIDDLQPRGPNTFVLRDINGDRLTDMVLLDNRRNAVVVVYGVGGGSYLPPQTVFPGDGISGIAVGPVRDHRSNDLVVSHGKQGTVQIIFSPFEER